MQSPPCDLYLAVLAAALLMILIYFPYCCSWAPTGRAGQGLQLIPPLVCAACSSRAPGERCSAAGLAARCVTLGAGGVLIML